MSSSHYLWPPDWEQIHKVTDQRVSPGIHKQLGVCFSECVPLWGVSDTLSSQDSPFGSPVRNGRFAMPRTYFSVMSGTKWQDREEKNRQGGPLSPFPPSCWDHSSTCRRGRVPSVRVLNPYRSVTHDVTAATLGLPRVRGVRTERRGGGNGWGISISEHTTP